MTIVALVIGLLSMGTLGLLAVIVWVVNSERVTIPDVAKVFIALGAGVIALFNALAAALRWRLPKILQVILGVGLGVSAICAYYEGFDFKYPKFYHRHEQYHSYIGAKYFPELGYDALYRCAAVAEDELGTVTFTRDDGSTGSLDLSEEVRKPGKTIRNLGVDNLLIPVTNVLAHPEACKDRFSPSRWDRFKEDIKFFRTESDAGYWASMQKDHGYGMSPVWTIAGRFFGELHAASVGYMQFLGALDQIYLFATFAALFWAFGFRVGAAAAILWGCQASAPFFWWIGAFLKFDWLFYLVLSVCLAKKGYFKLAGAAMVHASLLRVFPVYVYIGWLTLGAAYFFRHRRLAPAHRRTLIGAAIALGVLVPASLVVAGPRAYPAYFEREALAAETPLTNHMGLRVIVSQDLDRGRMKYAEDRKLIDPFAVWKQTRNDRYDRYFWVGYGVILTSLVAFVAVVRRYRLLWIGACLGQMFIILLSLLTSANYAFLILSAPLTRLRRGLEVLLFGFAALTQIIAIAFRYNDDRHTALSVVSLLFCFALLGALVKKAARRRRVSARGPYRDPPYKTRQISAGGNGLLNK